MSGACIQCGTELAETGAPIWESYCPNEACDYEQKRMWAGVRAAADKREREQYERLKAKFEPASGIETEGQDGETRLGAKHESPVPEGQTPK